MSGSNSRGLSLGLLAVALVAVLLAGQAAAAMTAPPQPTASTGATLGHTGFEYLGGLRKFAAAALWNRLDPQFDNYGEAAVDKRIEMLSTMRLVQLLDPQFQQTYYVAAFILARNGRMEQALDLAREGIAANPKAGFMRANYVQLLLMQDSKKNLAEMLRQTRIGLEPTTTFANADDQFESYGIFRTVLGLAGDTVGVAKLTAAQDALKAQDAEVGAEQAK